MRIFITGATGFIGGHLIEKLRNTTYELRCLVRDTSKADELVAAGADLVSGDITDRGSVLAGMQDCDMVVNLANLYSFWEADPERYAKINIDGTRNVMEAALEAGVAKVVHLSSVVIYGKPSRLPFVEETPPGPTQSEYARTKLAGDLLAWKLHRQSQLPLLMIYPGGVVGPGDTKASGQYILDLIERRLPTRVYDDAILSWVHVGDVAAGIVRALEIEDNVGEKYLLCAERLPMREFNRLVSAIANVRLPLLRLPDPLVRLTAAMLTALSKVTRKQPPWGMAADQMRTIRAGIEADGGKAGRELGLSYTPVRTALEEAIAWYGMNAS